MISSILLSVKKNLGLAEDYTAFDPDVVLYINSALSSLHQLGVGPEAGFSIADSAPTWDHLLGGDKRLNTVQSYVCLKVKMLFDPPQTGYLVTALEKQLSEMEFRILAQREREMWVSPEVEIDEEDLVLDGGAP